MFTMKRIRASGVLIVGGSTNVFFVNAILAAGRCVYARAVVVIGRVVYPQPRSLLAVVCLGVLWVVVALAGSVCRWMWCGVNNKWLINRRIPNEQSSSALHKEGVP